MPSRQQLSLEAMGAKLATVFTEADLHDAKETLRECLRATRTVRAGRDGGGHIVYEEVADYPIRHAAAVKIVEWAVGKPISRSVHADVSTRAEEATTSTANVLDLLLQAPDAAADILQKLKKAAEKAKKAEPVEVTATPALPKAAGSTS